MEDLIKKIKRLEFQMKLVGESISSEDSPIASLVISLNWGEAELEKAHDIFEKYNNELDGGKEPNWRAFEADFKDDLGIDYQQLKLVVLSFYRNFQWTEVCMQYALKYNCVEFHSITQNLNR